MSNALFTKEITVLGIGNIILSDEGFGVKIVEQLKNKFEFPDNVQLIDGGTLGIELTQFITGTEKLLIIDSIDGGKNAGTLYKFTGNQINTHFNEKISAHEVGIQDVLTALELTDKKIPEVIVIGAQPFSLEAGINLSPDMQKLVPKVIDMAIEILKSWQVNFSAVEA